MRYFEKKLNLLLEIKKKGCEEGITKICRKVYPTGSNMTKMINGLKSAKLIELKKVKHNVFSKLTDKGEKLVKLLIGLRKVLDD